VTYGPNINAAAILLASEGNVPLERTAMLMASLLSIPVSTGFVARALQRFAQRLGAAGFDEAMTTALRAENVLCADETPTNVIHRDTAAHGESVAGSAHAVTVRTPDARLVPIGSRSKTSIAGLGVLDGYAGYLVRDDYASWHQFDAQLAGVQQCVAHLIRHAKGVLELHPTQQQWTGQVITVLREAAAAVTEATTDQRDQLAPSYSLTCANATTTRSGGHRHQPLPRLAQGQPPRIQPRPTPPRQSRTSLDLHPKPRRALDKQRQ
jgi:transposase